MSDTNHLESSHVRIVPSSYIKITSTCHVQYKILRAYTSISDHRGTVQKDGNPVLHTGNNRKTYQIKYIIYSMFFPFVFSFLNEITHGSSVSFEIVFMSINLMAK